MYNLNKIGVVIFFLLILLTGCSEKAKYNVTVIKFADHPALNAVERNFINSLNSNIDSLSIITLNAHGNPSRAYDLAASVEDDIDLIVSLATPATQAASNTNSEVPILFGAVSDPIGAEIDLARASGITNVDSTVIRLAFSKIQHAYPDAETIGTFYNPTEQNSIFVQGMILEISKEFGFEIIQRAVSSPSQYQSILESISSDIDVLYCANDNLVNRAVYNISRTAVALNIPFFIGEISAVNEGPLAGIGVEYDYVGIRLAEIARNYLTEGFKLEIEGPSNVQFWINTSTNEELDKKLPSEVISEADSLLKIN